MSTSLVLQKKWEMNDIQNRADIENLVKSFYNKVHKDADLAPVFEMPENEWDRHLTRVVNFWENWLFQTGSYDGGMMWVHMEAHKKHGLTTERFEKWLALWFISTDTLFAGPRAEFVKKKALEIGHIMNAKMGGAI
ncbi:group III truncated hemoglobin [Emticicia sp. 21SJ11W-3]|uniref:group III truncated hemoglobin n=1 Tax=Emticicia sp. 21SJ11W-3 TaxID=2916755 RepID=UPI00209CAED0|nr:group III truncated hemoglobin [Emticicia sp. 21SJ11W-3]UTA69866.1 group III truncated hemoglobin [Emticicia sp. 21SJ11W-3]